MKINEIETPALLIDEEVLECNIKKMQEYADKNHVMLRPHAKTHKSAHIAKLQIQAGAKGIAVAKISEAEAFWENGIESIFIANEPVGETKYERIAKLAEKMDLSFGIDSIEQVKWAERVFSDRGVKADALIEIEVGENRSGVVDEEYFRELIKALLKLKYVRFKGLFSHDGNSYCAKDLNEMRDISEYAQKRTLHFKKIAEKMGMKCETVSYGSTPTFMNDVKILPGITEIRPGTYVYMDASQANAVRSFEYCAATVLSTVISRPTEERVILDVGAKGLTKQRRTVGMCSTEGFGTLLSDKGIHIYDVYDEHAIILNKKLRNEVKIGDKLRIIPVHICPVCNLYNYAYMVRGEDVIEKFEISAKACQI